MASVEIRSAFVEDNKGFVLKIAEPHSKKNESGGYDTTSRTFFDVKVSRDSGINLEQFQKGQRITLKGNQKTEVREWEGKKLYTLVIWADSIAVAGGDTSRQVSPSVANSAPVADTWATPAAPQQSVADQWAGNNITQPDAFADPTPF
jgi:hypothetical protein